MREGVAENDLGIADTAFCTLEFPFGVSAEKARSAIRQHGTLEGRALGKRAARGRTETGEVFEQKRAVEWQGRTLRRRPITVVLDRPTRGGDAELHVLTNLTATRAKATRVAELYRKRRTIEDRFCELAPTLDGEPNTRGYPSAALFAFCSALVASNAVALQRAALRAAHGAKAVEGMSRHHQAEEVRRTYPGMMVALPPKKRAAFRDLEIGRWAAVLVELARRAKPENYRKAIRGPKKEPPAKTAYKNGGHDPPAHPATAESRERTHLGSPAPPGSGASGLATKIGSPL